MLPGRIDLQAPTVLMIGQMPKRLQVIDALKRQVNIPLAAVVVYLRQPNLQPVSVGKKTALGPRLVDAQAGMPTIRTVTQRQRSVSLASGRVTQRALIQRDAIRVVLKTIRRYVVVRIVLPRGIHVPVESTLTLHLMPTAQLCRSTYQRVIGTREYARTPTQWPGRFGCRRQ